MTIKWHQMYAALGFSDINIKEKDINTLTRSVF